MAVPSSGRPHAALRAGWFAAHVKRSTALVEGKLMTTGQTTAAIVAISQLQDYLDATEHALAADSP